MVIFDMGVWPNLLLDFSTMFWHYLEKVNNLKVWKVYRFDCELKSILLVWIVILKVGI